MKTLDEIGLQYRTDKSSPYHNYLNTYEQYFKEFRDKEIIFMELGIGDINSKNREGESGLMWRDYFEKGLICLVDNDLTKVNRFNSESRICGYHIDQTDEAAFNTIFSTILAPHIIVDDASHIQANTIRSFEILFPLLQPGGLYCIEDTVTSYWPDWGGKSDVYGDHSYDTVMGYFFQMSHVINLKKQETFNPPQKHHIVSWWKEIDSIHFHHSQIIIKKK